MMLNTKDMSEVFLAPNDEMKPAHEIIDMDDRRKSSMCTSQSSSSSSEDGSQGDPTVDTSKI